MNLTDVQMIIQTAGVVIVGLVAGMMALLTAATIRRYQHAARQRQLSLQLMRERVEAVRTKRAASVETEAAWNGYRKFEVERKVDEGGDICSFYLVPHDRKPLPSFRPGQYLTFQLSIPNQSKPTIRCYSLSEAPGRDHYRVTIKKLSPPQDKPGAPPGLSSSFFHDHVDAGDILDVKAPGGHFFLDMATELPVVLIGGGVGLTPVLSMVNAIADSGSKRETWLFYGVRDRAEHVMADHLRRLVLERENLRLHVCYSRPGKGDVQGRDYHHAERVSVELFKRLLPSNNYSFYICGPPAMMESLVPGLEAWGVSKDRVHFEAFGPASVKRAAAPSAEKAPAAAAAAAIEVRFARSNKSCAWSATAGSLLEFAEANGIVIDSGCRAGNCGTCLTAIKSGEVQYTQEPGARPEEGSCLTCISVPKASLVLDA